MTDLYNELECYACKYQFTSLKQKDKHDCDLNVKNNYKEMRCLWSSLPSEYRKDFFIKNRNHIVLSFIGDDLTRLKDRTGKYMDKYY